MYKPKNCTYEACRTPFKLDKITNPTLAPLHEQLASFVNVDVARIVPGAQRGFSGSGLHSGQ